jgi:hypothetical protein
LFNTSIGSPRRGVLFKSSFRYSHCRMGSDVSRFRRDRHLAEASCDGHPRFGGGRPPYAAATDPTGGATASSTQ